MAFLGLFPFLSALPSSSTGHAQQSPVAPIMENLLKYIGRIDSHFSFAPDIVSAMGVSVLYSNPARGVNYTCETTECVAFGLLKSNPFMVHLQILQGNVIEVYVGDYTQGHDELMKWTSEMKFDADGGRKVSGVLQYIAACSALAGRIYNGGQFTLRDPGMTTDRIKILIAKAIVSGQQAPFGGRVGDIPELNMRLDFGVSRMGDTCILNMGRL
jgi:hypothetical protein